MDLVAEGDWRRRTWEAARTVVVKVGTQVLADESGSLSRSRMAALAGQVDRLRKPGRRVVLVSSGAIGAGMGRLGLATRPTELRNLQACAAVGQPFLMTAWEEAFLPFGCHVAQILLTAADFDHRVRYLNMRNTLSSLFEMGCVPIINENDTVSAAEIRFGDNDTLAAMVAALVQADALVLLSGVNGLFTADPRHDPAARRVPLVRRVDEVRGLAQATRSRLGTGGMRSKLKATRLAAASGTAVFLADGGQESVIDKLATGEDIGTLFLPELEQHMPAWKRWLGFTAQPSGDVVLDIGACEAVRRRGCSLLPIGVTAVKGEFGKGAVVRLVDPAGEEIGRGLTEYPSVEIEKLRGMRTEHIRRLSGPLASEEIIHRDNLVVTKAD
ncbi:MAG: glutamate 5-kinase [Planctomycetes bacterium]|nr:glutamate 5-kinase [Planctomycetota bacterium]